MQGQHMGRERHRMGDGTELAGAFKAPHLSPTPKTTEHPQHFSWWSRAGGSVLELEEAATVLFCSLSHSPHLLPTET